MRWFWNRESQKLPEEEEDDGYPDYEAKKAEAKRFWRSMKDWFSTKGYTLFELGSPDCTPLFDTPPETGTTPQYPYAFFGGDPPSRDPLKARYSSKVYFAQDVQLRHVAIKKLTQPDEVGIYRLLWEKRGMLAENCILPIIEILEHEEYRFVVMPRWGEDVCYPDYGSMKNVLHYIHCLLKAINFLHSNLIVHRDLKSWNTLVNHFGACYCNENNVMRPELRSKGLLTYALYDFDFSLMLPSNECRLPFYRSYDVLSIVWPYDVSQGELDYDPYKFEMGCLGIFLCAMFQICIPSAHFLAPFLDRLITHKLEHRFTSEEALKFFEKMVGTVTPEQLSLTAPMYRESGHLPWEPDQYNRWDGLPDKFVQEWGHFRAPRPSLYTKILRRLCTTVCGKQAVMSIRLFYRLITLRMATLPNYLYIFQRRLKI